jgi:hypothetical protein
MMGDATRFGAAALALAAVLSGCGDEAGSGMGSEWTAETEVRGDTTVVRTLAGSVWGDTMVLVPELAIGLADAADPADQPFLFGSPRGMILDRAGRIHVLDQQAREVRTFDADGRHLRSFGRQGQGPGEFSNPDAIRLLPGGEGGPGGPGGAGGAGGEGGDLVIRDQQGARFSVFTAEGEFVSSWPLASGFMTSTPFQVVRVSAGSTPDAAGGGAAGVRVSNPSLREVGRPLAEWEHVRVRYAPGDPSRPDTVPVPDAPSTPAQIRVESEGSSATYLVPFSPRMVWVELPDGSLAHGVSDRYSILVDRGDGANTENGRFLRIERATDRLAVDPAHAASERERLTAAARNMDPSWRWPSVDIPTVHPWFSTLVPGEDGTLWVFRPTPAVEEENPAHNPESPMSSPTRWVQPEPVADVFDADGRYLGPVRLPRGFASGRGPWLTRETVVSVATHEMGHEQVVRYRLIPASEAGAAGSEGR